MTSNSSNATSTTGNAPRFGSGQHVRRLEDDLLLKGQGQYTDDFVLPRQTHLVVLRSPYPHAHIKSIDCAAARAMPGVHLIVTGAEMVAAGVKPMPGAAGFKRADGSDVTSAARRALAHERVRFVGEPVAAIVADTVQQASDAADAIVADYEALPMMVNPHAALAADAPRLCDHIEDNIAAEMRHGSAAKTAAAFARAAHIVKLRINNQRLHALAIEPRSVLSDFDSATGRLTVHMSSQMPTGVRETLGHCLGMSDKDVRVQVGDVGGGFGMKTGAYPEDVTAAYCARKLARPVKWIAERGHRARNSEPSPQPRSSTRAPRGTQCTIAA